MFESVNARTDTWMLARIPSYGSGELKMCVLTLPKNFLTHYMKHTHFLFGLTHIHCIITKSKERCKDQELIQSSTTPDPGYQWESDKLTEDTPNRAKRSALSQQVTTKHI